jgi:hypothetical protein
MRARSGARCAGAGVALAAVLATVAGCAGGHGTPVRESQAVQNEVTTRSDAVLAMTQVKGKVTGGGSTEVSCHADDDANDPVRAVLDMWSLSGVDNAVLGKAMANLTAGLPRQGWKVLHNGPDSSRNRNQEIQAVHTATRTQLDVTWMKGLDGHEPLITFDFDSPCFRTPDGG